MELRPDEITKVLRQQIEQYTGAIDTEEVGTVLQVGDGIARVHGLENCVALEMLDLPHGVTGLALNLEEDNVGAGFSEGLAQFIDTMMQNPRKTHQHRQGQPMGWKLAGQLVQVYAGMGYARVGARDHVAVIVDVEVAITPIGDVIGVARFIDGPVSHKIPDTTGEKTDKIMPTKL